MSAYQCAPRSDLGATSIGLSAAGLLAWPRLSEKVHRPHHAMATGSDACFPLQDGEREALCCHIVGNIGPAACCLAIRTVRLSFLLPALHRTHGGRRRVIELKVEIWLDVARAAAPYPWPWVAVLRQWASRLPFLPRIQPPTSAAHPQPVAAPCPRPRTPGAGRREERQSAWGESLLLPPPIVHHLHLSHHLR